jgi:hypothetical protein
MMEVCQTEKRSPVSLRPPATISNEQGYQAGTDTRQTSYGVGHGQLICVRNYNNPGTDNNPECATNQSFQDTLQTHKKLSFKE